MIKLRITTLNIFFTLIYINSVYSQTEEKVNFCAYEHSGEFHSIIYHASANDSLYALCKEILLKTNCALTFNISTSDIKLVSATITETGMRFILINPTFFSTHPNRAQRIALLAHEIGHHANEHSLSPERKSIEELEADEFMGFALFRMGIVRPTAAAIASRYPLSDSTISTSDRKAAILRGYDRGEASILIAPNAALEDAGTGDAIPGIPEFPLNQIPQASATYQIDPYFSDAKTLSQVESKLTKALNNCGYLERRLFYVKGGFAMVTQIEQIKEDGYCLEANRWNTKPVREETFSLTSFFSSLFTSKPGYFRVFVFIVTDEPLVPKPRSITREEAMGWLTGAVSKLPPKIGQIAYTNATNAVAFVYEFTVNEADKKASLSHPSTIGAEAHLRNSKILSFLR